MWNSLEKCRCKLAPAETNTVFAMNDQSLRILHFPSQVCLYQHPLL